MVCLIHNIKKINTMQIEMRTLMDDNEMLSHIFLGCIPHDDLIKIRDKFVGDTDWRNESAKIPVQLKIGGVNVNPRKFFDSWKHQMEGIVSKAAQSLMSEKLGSEK